MSASETMASGGGRELEDYLGSSLSIGRDWLDALPQDDPRRTDVVVMAILVADWKQRIGLDGMIDEFLGDLRLILCHNCAAMHPCLAAVCRRKPIDCCWLLKGYRCRVSPPSIPPLDA